MLAIPSASCHMRTSTLALLLVALGILACGRSSPRPDFSTDSLVVIATGVDITGVNQLLDGDTRFNQDILDLMFLRVFEEQPDFSQGPPSFEPGLASRWSWSEDRTRLRIRLRPGVEWSDGTPLTAEDVRWSWTIQTDPEIAWSYAQSKEAIAEIRVGGPHELEVRFTHAYPGQVADLNEGVVMPRHAWGTLPPAEWRQRADWFVDNLVVSGPYRLESWRPQEEIVLVRNENFYGDPPPRIGRLVFRIIPEKSNQIRELLGGSVDFVDQVPPADATRLTASPGIELTTFWHRQFDYVCWNTERPLFTDTAVRRALTQAIDRQTLIETLWHGYARVAVSPILTSTWAHDPDLEPWPYDPREAARILDANGWADSDGDGVLDRDGVPFSFTLLTNADNRLRTDAAVMIQSQLRRVGIDAQVRRLEFNTLVKLTDEHDFDAFLGAWGIDTTLDLTYAFHSDSVTDGYNFGSYRSGHVDRLIDEARDELDPERKRELLGELEQHLHRDQPYTFLWEPQRLTAHSRRLRGVSPTPLTSLYRLGEWRLEPTG